jgi:hypothetical protein
LHIFVHIFDFLVAADDRFGDLKRRQEKTREEKEKSRREEKRKSCRRS